MNDVAKLDEKHAHELVCEPPLPFQVQPNPDEIWGTWIARLAKFNAYVSLKHFFDSLSIKISEFSARADPVATANHFAELARRCDQSTDGFHRRLTTLPYWECFYGRLSTETQAVASGSGGPRVGRSNKARSPEYLRVCPQCVAEDAATYGYAYIHRQHQLWCSRVCATHGTVLFDSCPHCKRRIYPALGCNLIGTRCGCGVALGEVDDGLKLSSIWKTLAMFDRKCLDASKGALQVDLALRWALTEITTGPQCDRFTSAFNAIVSVFGEEGWGWLNSRNARRHGLEHAQRGQRDFGSLELPGRHLPALFVALGVEFDVAVAHVATLRATLSVDPGGNLGGVRVQLPKPQGLEDAKRQVDMFLKEPGGRRLSAIANYCRTAYWILRTLDPDWLRGRLESSGVPHGFSPMPSILEDRSLIVDPQIPASMKRGATVRASIRDLDWVRARRRTLISERTDEEAEKLLQRLKAARAEHANAIGKPERFTIVLAAKIIGIPANNLTTKSKRYPAIRSLVPENSDSFIRRTVAWGLKSQASNGGPIALTAFMKACGIHFTPASKALVRKLLQDAE